MRGSIQKKGKNAWRLVFDLDRNHTGRRRQKVVSFNGTKRNAEIELARLISELENGGFVEPQSLTVAEYLGKWLASQKGSNVSAKTYERYEEICDRHLTPALGQYRLQKLQPMQIQSYYTEAQKTGRLDGKGGLAARTVLHHHRILRQALQQAVRWRLVSINPADAVKPPRPPRREIQTLTEQETAILLDGLSGTKFYVPSVIAVTAGLRMGEILGLQWGDIDLDKGTLSVRRTLERTRQFGLRLKEPKTKRGSRMVMLPQITIDVLRQHRLEQAQSQLRLGLRLGDYSLIISTLTGDPTNPRTFTSGFTLKYASIQKKTGIPRITFHGLRHTHATQLLAAGIHPKIAQERLGHSTIATTMDLYSHVTETMQEDAALRVDEALRSAIGKHSENKTR